MGGRGQAHRHDHDSPRGAPLPLRRNARDPRPASSEQPTGRGGEGRESERGGEGEGKKRGGEKERTRVEGRLLAMRDQFSRILFHRAVYINRRGSEAATCVQRVRRNSASICARLETERETPVCVKSHRSRVYFFQ